MTRIHINTSDPLRRVSRAELRLATGSRLCWVSRKSCRTALSAAEGRVRDFGRSTAPLHQDYEDDLLMGLAARCPVPLL